jgi:hypothetical protein
LDCRHHKQHHHLRHDVDPGNAQAKGRRQPESPGLRSDRFRNRNRRRLNHWRQLRQNGRLSVHNSSFSSDWEVSTSQRARRGGDSSSKEGDPASHNPHTDCLFICPAAWSPSEMDCSCSSSSSSLVLVIEISPEIEYEGRGRCSAAPFRQAVRAFPSKPRIPPATCARWFPKRCTHR